MAPEPIKRLEHLSAFRRFARGNGWVAEDPGRKIKSPRVTQRPVRSSFTEDEIIRILNDLWIAPPGVPYFLAPSLQLNPQRCMILPQCEGRCRVRLGQIGDSGENPTLSIVAVALRG